MGAGGLRPSFPALDIHVPRFDGLPPGGPGLALLAEGHDRYTARRITEWCQFGPLLYGVAFALAFVFAPASVTVNLLLALFFAVPLRGAQDGAQTR